MAQTPLPTRPALGARLKVALEPAEKLLVFEAAAKRGVTASQLVRELVKRAGPELSAA